MGHGFSQGPERGLILPRCLTYGSTDNELEDLILAEARFLHRGEILIRDLGRPPATLPMSMRSGSQTNALSNAARR